MITLVLVLLQSTENRSIKNRKQKGPKGSNLFIPVDLELALRFLVFVWTLVLALIAGEICLRGVV